MDDQSNQPHQPADTSDTDSQPQRYQHKDATRIVPMQRDHLGRPFWESYLTPEGYQVRAEAQIPPHLPGVIVFVHGVNSEGEWYDAAEAALCDGLNERLNRDEATKLEPNKYSTKDQTGRTVPRYIKKGDEGHSPVIRFYWGYRAEGGTEKRWRVPLRNDSGTDFWKGNEPEQRGPWYWGGGPFQNGTNNLQQLWSDEGFCRSIAGIDLQAFNTEWDRELHDAPGRQYYAHAAQRLADLIDRIRTKCPGDTVTVMSHSQGTMVAMAATLLCKTRAPDALFVMNSPYALKDKITDALTCGHKRPTEQARINTFRNIANRIKQDARPLTEQKKQLLQCGATDDMHFWRPDLPDHKGVPERDNHGRLYVYFCPHDRVMGASPLQSIGWQGVDDKLLAELNDTVKQRMLARGTPCGDEPGVKKFGSLPRIPDPEPGVDPDDFWNGNRRALGMQLWTVPNKNQTVTINAERVPNPLTAENMSKPIVRPVQTASGETDRLVYFDESRRDQDMLSAKWKDGAYKDPGFPYLESLLERQRHVQQDDPYANSGRRLGLETQDQLRKRIEEYQPMPTNHSTLPQHHEFLRRVVAWDLPVGFCDSYEEPGFWNELMKRADWTSFHDPYYREGKLDIPATPPQIDSETVADATSKADQMKVKLEGA